MNPAATGSQSPTCFWANMAAAVLSPVSIAVLIRKRRSSLMASATPVRQVSERLNIPRSSEPEKT